MKSPGLAKINIITTIKTTATAINLFGIRNIHNNIIIAKINANIKFIIFVYINVYNNIINKYNKFILFLRKFKTP